MKIEKAKSIIESIFFATGRMVSIEELQMALEMPKEDIEKILNNMQESYKDEKSGIELVKMND